MKKWIIRSCWMALGIAGLYGAAALAGVVVGGPLDPSGSPASSPGGIDGRIPIRQEACCPVYISGSGSYYLTGDIAVNSQDPAIVVSSPDVTLDLNGFTVGNLGQEAIELVSAYRVTIRNGRVWSAAQGILSTSSEETVLEDLDVRLSEPGSAVTLGHRATVRNVTVTITAFAGSSAGISTGHLADISGCRVTSDAAGFAGISVGDQSRVRDCTVTGFTDAAGKGIQTGAASRVTDCDVRSVRRGIVAGAGTAVERCTVGVYEVDGISVDQNASVTDNTIDFNFPASGTSCGIRVTGSNNRIDGNHLVNYAFVAGAKGVCVTGGTDTAVYRNNFYETANAISSVAGNGIAPAQRADSLTTVPWANIVN